MDPITIALLLAAGYFVVKKKAPEPTVPPIPGVTSPSSNTSPATGVTAQETSDAVFGGLDVNQIAQRLKMVFHSTEGGVDYWPSDDLAYRMATVWIDIAKQYGSSRGESWINAQVKSKFLSELQAGVLALARGVRTPVLLGPTSQGDTIVRAAPVVAGEGSVSATGPQAGGGIVLGPPVYGGGAMPTNAGLSTDLNRWIRSL